MITIDTDDMIKVICEVTKESPDKVIAFLNAEESYLREKGVVI